MKYHPTECPCTFNMKRILALVLILAPLFCRAQTDYDTYVPMAYSPMEYRPMYTGEPLQFQPYQDKTVTPTVAELKRFLERTQKYPDMKVKYKGGWDNYVDLASRYLAKGQYDRDLSNSPKMKHFQRDWTLLDHRYYEEELNSKTEAKKKMMRDSLAARQRFVNDSVSFRRTFVKDSTQARDTFVQDSVYRAGYRNRYGFDYVAFDGPHGEPLLCYRGGKLIQGKTFNEYGLIEKIYRDGKLVNRFQYNDAFLYRAGKSNKSVSWSDDAYIDDSVQSHRLYYSSPRDSEIDKIFMYGKNNKPTKAFFYGRGVYYKPDVDAAYYPNPERTETYTYHPDNKTISTVKKYYKTEDRIEYYEHYSDGTRKQMTEYRHSPYGGYTVKLIRTYEDGYNVVQYFDFDGKLERRVTESQSSSSDYLDAALFLGLLGL